MDLTGQKLGKYEILEKLGQGGMAQVYKARQPLIERFVAIKVMQTHLTDLEQFVNKFLREAQRLGQLRHPNIVSILDFDIMEGTHFLVMDFVSGSSLGEYLEMRKSLSPAEALEYFQPDCKRAAVRSCERRCALRFEACQCDVPGCDLPAGGVN